MKKIDKLVLDAFIGPFLITFFVVVFILLNINMLKYFDDIIGKGLDTLILGQLFFYFAIFTVPTAMPLAVLLSSLIAFGNLGEHFELTAIKSAGISLVRILLPIFLLNKKNQRLIFVKVRFTTVSMTSVSRSTKNFRTTRPR